MNTATLSPVSRIDRILFSLTHNQLTAAKNNLVKRIKRGHFDISEEFVLLHASPRTIIHLIDECHEHGWGEFLETHDL